MDPWGWTPLPQPSGRKMRNNKKDFREFKFGCEKKLKKDKRDDKKCILSAQLWNCRLQTLPVRLQISTQKRKKIKHTHAKWGEVLRHMGIKPEGKKYETLRKTYPGEMNEISTRKTNVQKNQRATKNIYIR